MPKLISNRQKKIETEREKLQEFIKKSDDKIKDNFESIEKSREKIDDKFPGAFNYNTSSYVKKEIVKVWEDSINMQIDSLKKIQEDFQALRAKTRFNEFFSDIEFARSLAIAEVEMIKENNYTKDDYIHEVDTLITISTSHSLMLFSDSLRLELLGKETLGTLRNINNYIRNSRTDFKAKQLNNEISDTEVYEEFIQSMLVKALDIVEEINQECRNFNNAVTQVLKPYRSSKELTKLLEEIVELKEKKYDYISEYIDADHDRNTQLIELMDEKSREWKALYEPKK